MAKKQFKAESKRLLDMMINSIYTHKEIFLRELISNASDAIDKLAYLSLTDEKVGLSRSDFAIWLTLDKEGRTITIEDNGIGMTREELETNLGTIAKSGSLKFKQELAQTEGDKGDVDVIGQFGVGFYSAFMVADKVTVTTRAYGSDEAYQWESTGADGYTVTETAKTSVGTKIVLHIKDNAEGEDYDQFLSQYKLQALVKKYSDYVRFPIKMAIFARRPIGISEEKRANPLQTPRFGGRMKPKRWESREKRRRNKRFLRSGDHERQRSAVSFFESDDLDGSGSSAIIALGGDVAAARQRHQQSSHAGFDCAGVF